MVTTVSHAKVAEPIEMPYGRCTLVGRRNHVFHGGLDPPGEEAMSGTSPSSLLSISRIHTHTNVYRPLVQDSPGRPVPEETLTHSQSILIIGHPLSSSSIYNEQWHPLCSFYVLDSPLVQPFSRSSLVFLLVLNPQLHTPYISSPNYHLLFAAHAHTNAACSAAIPMLCHVYLVSQLLTWESVF